MPDVLYEEIIEVHERVVFKQEKCQLGRGGTIVTGTTKEEVVLSLFFILFSEI